jgi:RNA ligase (TIGR02306 family)
MENLRKLASIRVISDIQPIEGADAIELAIVDGWKVVVAKNVGHQIGNKVVYCEIDSFLPIEPEFEFLRKTSFKKMGEVEGFRLKTIKLRGQLSQGLLIPLDDAIQVMKRRNGEVYTEMLEVGKDVSQLLGIQKYEPPIPAELAGKVKGLFPSFLRKTDEERVQNLKTEYEEWKNSDKTFYVTEKLDGSSATFYIKDDVFGVCSRNLELLETEGNTFWKVARKLDLEAKMRNFGGDFSLQGELIGEGIQGNPYKIAGHSVRFFNVFDVENGEYLSLHQFKFITEELGLETVPILDENFKLPDTIDELLAYAENKSVLNPNFDREGVVIRSTDRTVSFKSISNKFLLKEK